MRNRLGVSIATIQRGATVIAAPAGDTRIFPGDVLGVIGTDEQIQETLGVVERENETSGEQVSGDFKLTTVQLSESSPLIGKSVAQSRLASEYSTLLVSVGRGEEFITPSPDTVFAAHDILWVVANPKTLAALR